jgi:hypothetical protein
VTEQQENRIESDHLTGFDPVEGAGDRLPIGSDSEVLHRAKLPPISSEEKGRLKGIFGPVDESHRGEVNPIYLERWGGDCECVELFRTDHVCCVQFVRSG